MAVEAGGYARQVEAERQMTREELLTLTDKKIQEAIARLAEITRPSVRGHWLTYLDDLIVYRSILLKGGNHV